MPTSLLMWSSRISLAVTAGLSWRRLRFRLLDEVAAEAAEVDATVMVVVAVRWTAWMGSVSRSRSRFEGDARTDEA